MRNRRLNFNKNIKKQKQKNLCMMKVWLNVLSKQRENAINKVIQRARISYIISNFGKKTKMNTSNLIHHDNIQKQFVNI